MTVIATSSQTLSNVVKNEHQAELAYCRKVAEFDDTNGAVVIGAVLGLKSGKWELALQTGTYTEFGVAVNGPITSGTKASAIAINRGPASVSKAGLVLHSSYDLDAEKNALYASLEGQGIQVLDKF